MVYTYGIVSDLHRNEPIILKKAVQVLKKLGAQTLIFNGDYGDLKFTEKTLRQGNRVMTVEAKDFEQTLRNYHQAFLPMVESGLETIIIPGSHEVMGPTEHILDFLKTDYSNLIDGSKLQMCTKKDHQLLIMPGSDTLSHGEFHLGTDLPSGKYMITPRHEIVTYKNWDEFYLGAMEGKYIAVLQQTNPDDILKMVSEPEKTIALCHVPRRFSSREIAVDMAHFGETKQQGIVPYVLLEKQIKNQVTSLTGEARKEFAHDTGISMMELDMFSSTGNEATLKKIAAFHGYTIKRECRGNKDLQRVYEATGITKAISGHFHESVHRAHDIHCKPVLQETYTDSLFWMASYLDSAKVGLLRVDGHKVMYENVNLQFY